MMDTRKLPCMLRHVRNTICTSKVMITVFLWRERLIYVDILDPSETFAQDHFTSFVLSDPKKSAQNLCGRKHPIELAVYMDNSRCYKGQKVSDKMRHKHDAT
jgi:hypothetical protein